MCNNPQQEQVQVVRIEKAHGKSIVKSNRRLDTYRETVKHLAFLSRTRQIIGAGKTKEEQREGKLEGDRHAL